MMKPSMIVVGLLLAATPALAQTQAPASGATSGAGAAQGGSGAPGGGTGVPGAITGGQTATGIGTSTTSRQLPTVAHGSRMGARAAHVRSKRRH